MTSYKCSIMNFLSTATELLSVVFSYNKMQTSPPVTPGGELDQTTCDVQLVPPPGNWTKHRGLRVVFVPGIFTPLCESMTSSTKPEIHNILYFRPEKDRATPQVTCRLNLVKCVFEKCKRTDSQTNIHTRCSQYLAFLRGVEGRSNRGQLR